MYKECLTCASELEYLFEHKHMEVDDCPLQTRQLGVGSATNPVAVQTEDADALRRGDAETTAHLG